MCFLFSNNIVKKGLDFMSPWISMLQVSIPLSVVSLLPLCLCLSLSSILFSYTALLSRTWEMTNKLQPFLGSIFVAVMFFPLSLNRVLSNEAEIAPLLLKALILTGHGKLRLWLWWMFSSGPLNDVALLFVFLLWHSACVLFQLLCVRTYMHVNSFRGKCIAIL